MLNNNESIVVHINRLKPSKSKPEKVNRRRTLPTMYSADNNVLNESNTDNELDNDDNSTLVGCGPILQYAEPEVAESELSESEEEDDVPLNATFLDPKDPEWLPERPQHVNPSPHQSHSYNLRPRDPRMRE